MSACRSRLHGRTTSRASSFRRLKFRRCAEVFREMGQSAHHRIRREAAKRAERTKFHGVTEIFEQRRVVDTVVVANDAVNDFDAARRADTAWRAFAAGLNGAEFHREARRL